MLLIIFIVIYSWVFLGVLIGHLVMEGFADFEVEEASILIIFWPIVAVSTIEIWWMIRKFEDEGDDDDILYNHTEVPRIKK